MATYKVTVEIKVGADGVEVGNASVVDARTLTVRPPRAEDILLANMLNAMLTPSAESQPLIEQAIADYDEANNAFWEANEAAHAEVERALLEEIAQLKARLRRS